MLILGLLCMYFDAVVVFVTSHSLFSYLLWPYCVRRGIKKEQGHIRDFVWAVQGKPKNELGSLKSGNLGCLAVAVQCVFCRVVHIIGKALIGVLRPPHSPPPPLLSTEQYLNSHRKFWVAPVNTKVKI